jgi:hypothetical protein
MTKQAALIEQQPPLTAAEVYAKPEPQAMTAPTVDTDDSVSMFERLARDPNVDVEKIERLIGMQERIMAHKARAAFNAAFAQMQGELPIIDEKGQILVNGQLRSRFGKHEDIQEAVKPILAKFGFAINHKNRRLENGRHLIIGVLRHREGHSEEDEFECPPDASGGKNDVQAIGSTREYGRRYTTISLLNIVTKGVDDDGKGSSKPPAPEGYEQWLLDLEAVADEGTPKLTIAWNKSAAHFKNYITRNEPEKKKAITD